MSKLDNKNITELISLSEASRICRLSPDHLRRLVEQEKLWGVKIGRNWITTKKAILDYLQQEHHPGRKPKKLE